jgi:hypothetical protein
LWVGAGSELFAASELLQQRYNPAMFIYQRLHLLLAVNPVTLSAEEVGKAYYLDFTPAG